jgi:tetratricopeptide (TPR) repeat protein
LTEAQRIFNEGLRFDGNHIGILTALVSLYLDQKEQGAGDRSQIHSMARETCRKAVGILKLQVEKYEHAGLLRQLAELMLKMEAHNEGEDSKDAEMEKYLRRSPTKDNEAAATYVDLGVLYTRKEDLKRAAQYFTEALQRDPDDLNAWSNLAEAYSKSKRGEEAEAEYRKILAVSENHVESCLGLAQVFTERADELKDEELYEQAVEQFAKAIEMGRPIKGYSISRASKTLKKKELAAALYSKGYARVRQFEASEAKTDRSLLQQAREDFRECCNLDPEHYQCRRAIEKLDKRLGWFSPNWLSEKMGPYIILGASISVFVMAQVGFFRGHPGKIEASVYVTVTLSSLVFMVVGLYLPQILKLKVAGIELEKSAVSQISTSEVLGIATPRAKSVR